MGESKITVLGIKDTVNIIGLRLARLSGRNPKEMMRISGVPINVLSNMKRNREFVSRVKQQFEHLAPEFEKIIDVIAQELKISGKHHETDLYLERGILEGGREQDAYRHFLVERHEVDRVLLTKMIDHEKVNLLSVKATSSAEQDAAYQNSLRALEIPGKKKMGSVFNELYSSELVLQLEYYFDLIFKEESIVHVLSKARKIFSILRLPYELPQPVYSREAYRSRSSCSLTKELSAFLMEQQLD
ncbi:MAG: hypothetical protein HQM13_04535 [SAR324 cluster bacterium]|nr:hypothetical protein [SAR324 cluster bacterium]